ASVPEWAHYSSRCLLPCCLLGSAPDIGLCLQVAAPARGSGGSLPAVTEIDLVPVPRRAGRAERERTFRTRNSSRRLLHAPQHYRPEPVGAVGYAESENSEGRSRKGV